MILLTALTVGLIFGVSIYMLLGKELKSIAMGVFLLGYGANLAIIAASESPIGKLPPVLGASGQPTGAEVDPLPQALILTAIVIGFAVQAFVLSLLVLTWRRTRTVDIDELAGPDPATQPQHKDATTTRMHEEQPVPTSTP